MSQIPVICDRCRATGAAGEGDFAHLGDLLEFEPVPRQNKRRNGWGPTPASFALAGVAAGIRSRNERATAFSDLLNDS